jgi:curved DNA-binding protein CbpA
MVCTEIINESCYYKVLGVEKGATDSQLKKGFHKKSVKVHPDKNPAPVANDAFTKVNQAYQTLTDP